MQRFIAFVCASFALCVASLAQAQDRAPTPTEAYAPHGVSYTLSCPVGRPMPGSPVAPKVYQLSIPRPGVCDTRGLPNSVICMSNASGPIGGGVYGSLDYVYANCREGGCITTRGGGRCVGPSRTAR